METLGDKKVANCYFFSYYCEQCDYKCCKKFNFEKHLSTRKHQKVTLANQKVAKVATENATPNIVREFFCDVCNKKYQSRNGLWKHKKSHHSTFEIDHFDAKKQVVDKDLIMTIIKDNAELKNMLMKVVENGTNNTIQTTNINSNNKSFNLNFFLNETCKDAMNISDFVSSIKMNLDDLEHTGRKGYIEGISNIIVKNLNNIEQHMRPLHCSDQKREILYIKDNNEWTKESDDKPILTRAIKVIANENIKQIKHWAEQHPDCTQADSRKNELYLKIVSNSMNGLTVEEGKKNINKIISNVAKEIVIQKDIH
jgi:hypothetical protein